MINIVFPLIFNRFTRLFFHSIFISALIYTPVVVPQFRDDPIPQPLDTKDTTKVIVVNLDLKNGEVSGHSIEVVFGHAPARIGNPPLIRSDLYDFRGKLIEQFNSWHPSWTFTETENGTERLIIDSEAQGNITFPFFSGYGTMDVIDVKKNKEILFVDLVPAIRAFCKDNIGDSDCQGIADLDGDGKLDEKDLNIFLATFGTCKGDTRFNLAYDYDSDKCITFVDYQILSQFFNK